MFLLLQRPILGLCARLGVRQALTLALRILKAASGFPGETFGTPLGTITIRATSDEPCGGQATEEEPEEARRRAAVVIVHRFVVRGVLGCV